MGKIENFPSVAPLEWRFFALLRRKKANTERWKKWDLEKYTSLIEERNYSYIVYNYNNIEARLKVIKKYNGKNKNRIKEEKLNCYICSNTVKMYKKTDKYINAVAELYEEERRERYNEK